MASTPDISPPLLSPTHSLPLSLSSSYSSIIQGKAGNAAQYITRNQALKKLQLKLFEFRYVRKIVLRSKQRQSRRRRAPTLKC